MLRNGKWLLAAALLVGGSVPVSSARAWQEEPKSEAQEEAPVKERLESLRKLLTTRPNERLSAEKLDEAEALMQGLIRDKAAPPELLMARQMLSQQQFAAGRLQDAAGHLLANIQALEGEVKTRPAAAGPLSMNLNQYSAVLQRMGKAGETIPLWRSALAAVRENQSADESAKSAVANLRRGLITSLMLTGGVEEAKTLAQTSLTEARADHEAEPESAPIASRLADAMAQESQLAQREGGAEAAALETTLLGFLDRQVAKHPKHAPLLSMFLSRQSSRIRDLSRSDPDAALQELGAYVKRLNELKGEEEGASPLITQALVQSKSLERMIEAERKRLALIGQPAIPLEAEAWANGSPLSSADLKGKVVLLDFWAVWCGPCIATFPHLRDWHEKYSDRGFQVVGVTRYYEYGWNAETKRPSRTPELSHEDERKALDQFAEHHQLKHPFAIVGEGSKFQEEYGVTGIPQAVLIDKQGTVRLIRVGSGDKNAHDLEEMIEKLLAE